MTAANSPFRCVQYVRSSPTTSVMTTDAGVLPALNTCCALLQLCCPAEAWLGCAAETLQLSVCGVHWLPCPNRCPALAEGGALPAPHGRSRPQRIHQLCRAADARNARPAATTACSSSCSSSCSTGCCTSCLCCCASREASRTHSCAWHAGPTMQ